MTGAPYIIQARAWADLRPPTPRERLDAWPLGLYRERREIERRNTATARQRAPHGHRGAPTAPDSKESPHA